MAAQSRNSSTSQKDLIDPETRKQVNDAADKVRTAVNDVGHSISDKSQGYLNRVISPDQREAIVSRFQDFNSTRPKLSAFIGLNLLLSGIPIALFAFFSVSVFFSSLFTTISIAVITAVTFSMVSIGTALLVLLPTLFFTTIAATVIFVWGLTSYYLLQLIQARRRNGPTAAEQNVRDKMNRITGSVKNGANEVEDRFSKAWNNSGTDGASNNYTTSRYGSTTDKNSVAAPRGTLGADDRTTVVVPGTGAGKTGAVIVTT